MNTDQRLAVRTVLSGMLALAVALGIGRFALTPLLPLMQQDAGLSLAAGSSLASANYLGYLIGALLAVRSSHSRQHWNWFALFCIAASTAAMALSRQLQIWLILRLLAGIASAWALIFTTAHVQHHMARHDWAYAGWLFGGVGLGIIGSGLICLALAGHLASWQIWLVLGLICLILVGLARALDPDPAEDEHITAVSETGTANFPRRRAVILTLSYGLFGFGYIISATFLPAMARQVLDDPHLYGWIWPVFGTAALASTLLAGRLSQRYTNQSVWRMSQLVMAFGVAMPAQWDGLFGIVCSTLCVGGTFLVITLAAMQEARRTAAGRAAVLIAVMTGAFAFGQLLGPLAVGLAGSSSQALRVNLWLAATALLMGAVLLWLPGARSSRTVLG